MKWNIEIIRKISFGIHDHWLQNQHIQFVENEGIPVFGKRHQICEVVDS